MASNSKLSEAKSKKNDEFYTQYADIEKEVNAYLEYDSDVFRGKTILLPCDDPESSNFTIFFAQNFERLGLKKLISTSYAVDSKDIKGEYIPSEFEQNSPLFDWASTRVKGKIFVLEKDITGDGKINHSDLEWSYLEGDGDFRSEEVCKLRDEADIIITNPPFSLFREFVAWLIEGKKKFLLIGNLNAIKYRDCFPLLMNNQMWLGNGFAAGNAYFSVPSATVREYANGVYDASTGLVHFRNCAWFTNLEHGKRHQPLKLMTMEDNLKFSRHKEIRGQKSYLRYDNFDAIEVPYTDAIPSDYEGVMGVPISFFDKYSPDQFEIVGISQSWFNGANKIYPPQMQIDKNGKESVVTKLNDGPVIELASPPADKTYYKVDGKIYTQLYCRILIRKVQAQ